MYEFLGEIRTGLLSVVFEWWELMPGSCCDSRNFTQVKQHLPKRMQATGPTSPQEAQGSCGPASHLPHPPIQVVFHNFPSPRVTRAKKNRLQVVRDGTTTHLRSFAGRAGGARAAAKRQRAGSPGAAGCLDFSQGIF